MGQELFKYGRFVISKSKIKKHGFFTEEVVYKYFFNGRRRSKTNHERIVV